MDEQIEKNEFDEANFTEKLRRLSVEDQKIKDKRYVWKKTEGEELEGDDEKIEKELSRYATSSDKTISAVVQEFRNNPDESGDIMDAVDKFLARSMGTNEIEVRGIFKRPQDLFNLWMGSEQRSNFWKKVAKELVSKPEIKSAETETRTKLDKTLERSS
jgi:hypothetical protein